MRLRPRPTTRQSPPDLAGADPRDRRFRSEQVAASSSLNCGRTGATTSTRSQADTHRAQAIAIGDDQEDAVARLAAELRARRRRERHRVEADARQRARVERRGQRRAVDPRRADLLERRVGAAADRDVRAFDRADPGIHRRRDHVAHVRRRVRPTPGRSRRTSRRGASSSSARRSARRRSSSRH